MLVSAAATESVETEADSERYYLAQHPYGSGYKDHMAEPFYADTWRHVQHTHLANDTAYENDQPTDYDVEPTAGSCYLLTCSLDLALRLKGRCPPCQ